VLAVLFSFAASAHPPGLSRSEWSREGNDVSAVFITAGADNVDAIAPRLVLPCTLTGETSKAIENDGVEARLRWRCPSTAS
jgi:hypothetical protein